MTRREQAIDLALAVVVGVLAAASARATGHGPTLDGSELPGGPWRHGPMLPEGLPPDGDPVLVPLGVALLMLGTVLRRRAPRVGYLLVLFGTATYLAAGGPYGPVLLAPALAVVALLTTASDGPSGALTRRWPLLLGVPLMLTAGSWTAPVVGLASVGLYAAVIFGTGVVLLPGAFAVLHRLRRQAAAADRAADLRRVADAERLRIAQEVHDVVGHSLSVINLQAGVALHVLDRQPQLVAAALEAIRSSSRAALAELRTTLDLVREPGDRPPAEPVPGLDRLETLLAAVRAAGRRVELHLPDGVRDGLPAAVDHAAYRIVQEAVTNAVRHAPEADITVALHRSPDRLVIEVSDAGPVVDVSSFVAGTGMSGLRTRAETLGGTLTLGGRPRGGVVVRADLPVGSNAASTERIPP